MPISAYEKGQQWIMGNICKRRPREPTGLMREQDDPAYWEIDEEEMDDIVSEPDPEVRFRRLKRSHDMNQMGRRRLARRGAR